MFNVCSMQSVDESYEFVSLETDGMGAGDARTQSTLESESAPEPEPASDAQEEPATVFDHYPPRSLRELAEENGIHYFEDGHFYTEVCYQQSCQTPKFPKDPEVCFECRTNAKGLGVRPLRLADENGIHFFE